MKTNTNTADLTDLTIGQSIKLNGRTFTVSHVIDMAKRPNLAKITRAIYVINGPRSGAYRLDVSVGGVAVYSTVQGTRATRVETAVAA